MTSSATTTRPTPPPPVFGAIPAELQDREQWVNWRYEHRDGGWTKPPVNAATGQCADNTDPATWGAYRDVVVAYREGGFDGIGYVFSVDDPYCGIDLDDCIDADGTIEPWAAEIICGLDSYAEVSPSGRGVKIFLRGALPGGKGRKANKQGPKGTGAVEVYDRRRYFTVTGHRLDGTPATIEERDEQLAALYQRLFSKAKAKPPQQRSRKAAGQTAPGALGFPGSDDELLDAIARSRSGEKFEALWSGDTSAHGGDDSAADLALCNLLAWWCGPDPARIDAMFRRSGLHRDKWDERHGEKTYGQMTISKALEGRTEFYSAEARPTAKIPDPPVEPRPDADALVFDPRDPLTSAQKFRQLRYTAQNMAILYRHGDVFRAWDGRCYPVLPDSAVRAALYETLGQALRPMRDRHGKVVGFEPFRPNKKAVDDILDALRADAHLPAARQAPCWLTTGDSPPAAELLPMANGLLHLPTRKLYAATPAFWGHHALDFGYEPEAPEPVGLRRFLADLWPEDEEARDTLQEWFGYVLSTDTSQQKIGLIVGPRRSGKGTIARVLTGLLGPANVCGPTLASLGSNFGLQALIDKPLAIISDARLSSRSDQAVIAERLLTISGEDVLTIDRKYAAPWTGRLPTRLLILTNELPRLADASGAMAGRFIVLRLVRSFYGKEDIGLTARLLAELPAVLNWALDGLQRLRDRGFFVQPTSSEKAIADLEDLGSPVAAFMRDRCQVGAAHWIAKTDLFAAWRAWCEDEGREHPGTQASFGRDLLAAEPSLSPGQRRHEAGKRFRTYEGIRLNPEGA